MNQKILGIDLGTKKSGLAYSDDSGLLAFAWKTLEEGLKKQLVTLTDLIIEGNYHSIVFGIPSQEGEWPDKIQQFASDLEEALSSKEHQISISFQDEDFTSFQAGQNLSEIKSKLPKKKRQQMDTSKDDAEAARIMLQSWIDKHSR